MRLPHSFQRRKGASPEAMLVLGSDTSPTWDSPAATPRDNILIVKATTPNGYGLAGFLLAFSGPATEMLIELWSFESTTQSWVLLADAVTVERGQVTRVDSQIPTEMNGVDVLVVPKPVGTEDDGIYTFGLSGIHTP